MALPRNLVETFPFEGEVVLGIYRTVYQHSAFRLQLINKLTASASSSDKVSSIALLLAVAV